MHICLKIKLFFQKLLLFISNSIGSLNLGVAFHLSEHNFYDDNVGVKNGLYNDIILDIKTKSTITYVVFKIIFDYLHTKLI